MNDKPNIKNKWLHLRLSDDEYKQLQKEFSKTTERKISKYARKILLGKPLISGHRNLTLDGLIAEFSSLVKTLNGLANNFNQSVHKLHTLNSNSDLKAWAIHHELDKEALLKSIEAIKQYLKEHSQKWLQS